MTQNINLFIVNRGFSERYIFKLKLKMLTTRKDTLRFKMLDRSFTKLAVDRITINLERSIRYDSYWKWNRGRVIDIDVE